MEMYWVWVKICEYLLHSSLFESLILILGLCALANGTFLTEKKAFSQAPGFMPYKCHLSILLKSRHYMDAYRNILILFHFYLTHCIPSRWNMPSRNIVPT